ncbi:acylphosphatase [Janthinobacterium sp. 17J80-10]|uniref:acylphosphatase n=1 Tax=Janthinobacterium sp. 17J80-10 TaxID=2497863 RepID=UPI0010055A8B|nr:acylphosphatase [Janthinobacterium sp. 17J80-10]QAU35842.1 acylphosphatase [Janthinobacterium sp. 17J80-10]
MPDAPSSGAPLARHLRISGKVQGVGYRIAFEQQARTLGLAGWVRNRLDGSVEALVAGEPKAIEAIIIWSHHGPAAAQVEDVAIIDAGDTALEPGKFERLRTA